MADGRNEKIDRAPARREPGFKGSNGILGPAGFVKYWEIIADRLKKACWSHGCVSAVDSEGRTIWIVDAHRDDGRRFVVRADEILTALLEGERAMHHFAVSLLS